MIKQQSLDGIERSRETKTKVVLANHKGHKSKLAYMHLT